MCHSKRVLGSHFGLVYWGLTPQQQPGSYQGGAMMMKSVFWWRKPEYPEETTEFVCTVSLSHSKRVVDPHFGYASSKEPGIYFLDFKKY